MTLPSTVFTHPRPEPRSSPVPSGTRGRCSQPASSTLEAGQSVRVDHRLPPQMPVGWPQSPACGTLSAAQVRNATGRPSSVTCTAATNGVLPSAPRPNVCLLGLAPQVGIVHLHNPAGRSSSRSFMHLMKVLQRPAVLADSQLDDARASPRNRSSTGSNADTWRETRLVSGRAWCSRRRWLAVSEMSCRERVHWDIAAASRQHRAPHSGHSKRGLRAGRGPPGIAPRVP